MGSEWRTVRLGDVTDILTGYPFRSAEFVDDGIPLVRGDNVGQGRLRWEGVRCWPKHRAAEMALYSVQADDVILAMDRPWIEAGLKYAAVQSNELPALLVQRVARIRASDGLDQRFLKYILSDRAFTEYILSVQTGTTVPHISSSQIAGYGFSLPSLDEQRRIASILGALDDKIELNRRMCRTLDEMAQAIFKSWFIEFATSPHYRVGSLLGPIPNGWSIGTVGDIAEVIDCLHSKKPERIDVGRPLLQLKNIRDDGLIDMGETYCVSDADYATWTSRMEARAGDCVITNVGRSGAVAQLPQGLKAALGRNMTGVRHRPDFPYPTYLIELLRSPMMKAEIELKLDAGTILSALNVRSIPGLRFPMPPVELVREYEEAMRPVRSRMEQLLAESMTLASLRDALLPRLISGELRVT